MRELLGKLLNMYVGEDKSLVEIKQDMSFILWVFAMSLLL